MESSTEQWVIPEGTEVVDVDGDKVGKVIDAQGDYIVVEKGWLFPTDSYVPRIAIASYDGDKAYLAVTKDEALNQTWDVVPDAYTTDRAYATEDRVIGTASDRSAETLRVPVHEEELTATKRPVERGRVRIDKEVIEEDRTLEVPVTEERVTVTRRAVDRDASVDATAFREETIEVPLRGEVVDVQKQNRVVEEVEIGKERVGRTERVADTVRREEVRIDQADTARTTRWTPRAAADYDVLTGKDVYSAEGDKVGTVKGVYHPTGAFAASVGRHYFLLDPGLLRDWFGGYDEVFLPESAIDLVTTERVDLGLTKDQIKGQDWTTRPADLDTYRWA